MNHAISSHPKTSHLTPAHTHHKATSVAKSESGPADQVSLSRREHGEHDPSANRLMEGMAQLVEGGHRQANKLVDVGMNAVRHAPHHGSAGAFLKAAESPAGKVAGKVASGFSGGMALFEQFSAINNPELSQREKSKEVWGAAFGAVGAVGGGALGAVEGLGVASIPLGIGGAIVVGDQGKKLGQEFGGWLLPEPHQGSGRLH